MRRILSALGGRDVPAEEERDPLPDTAEPVDAPARDTLATVLRALGSLAFDTPACSRQELRGRCEAWARHVVTGAVVEGAPLLEDASQRAWTTLSEFVRAQRRSEQRFVVDLSSSLKSVVSDLISGLRGAVEDDESAEAELRARLDAIEAALQADSLEEVRALVPAAVGDVRSRLEERRRSVRERMVALSGRLREMRSHLDATRREAETDPLTRIPNRSAFDRAFRETVELAATSGEPLILAVMDLDHFKLVNDEHGHLVGDRVLREAADALVRTFPRKDDFVARYGGEEFVALIGDADEDTADLLVERLLGHVRGVRVTAAGGDITVTASVGYTALRPEDSLATLFDRADRALYEAKASGRDRACRG